MEGTIILSGERTSAHKKATIKQKAEQLPSLSFYSLQVPLNGDPSF
ncbi:hypothetical protein JAO76_09605 [Pontibacter sp. BT310]|uniref:Uncharacterized protein n=1 Tax=Pontibacter populi TaxID=890055 RepID=A0ABS6XDT6_9BACT|nr:MULTISPECIES: hypothetical protein [Pontibacter]MBJ6118447.1 hypothetical protein [Pontibacter sp. BT310]MBR0570875.1 hypothetical protein [Microvirga sp. STS03]MBW3365301.1 hypothetical protein [Pontibacter populi]